jgi:hypothetical protein
MDSSIVASAEHRECDGPAASGPVRRDGIILDFLAGDVDAESAQERPSRQRVLS